MHAERAAIDEGDQRHSVSVAAAFGRRMDRSVPLLARRRCSVWGRSRRTLGSEPRPPRWRSNVGNCKRTSVIANITAGHR